MSCRSLAKSSRLLARGLGSSSNLRPASRLAAATLVRASPMPMPMPMLGSRFLGTCAPRLKGIMPDTDTPSRDPVDVEQTYTVVELAEAEYHELADAYMDRVLTTFEAISDSRGDVDVEFAAGVLTISTKDKGTYVINKQPPNKQIWLSSPISGPKRYDWCVIGETQGEKEDTASGSWVYARDGSSLDGLLLEELGVDTSAPEQS